AGARRRTSQVWRTPNPDLIARDFRRRFRDVLKLQEVVMSVTEELLRNAERYAEGFDKGNLPMPPGKHVAIVACMDARLNVYGLLGLTEGDAHVIRNAGGVVSDDAIRSLTISQRLLGTTEIILIHHTDCGMLTFTDDDVKTTIAEETGIR